jgi:hypothetical protein
MGELIQGQFTVPENPLRNTPGLSGIGLAELLNGSFSVPQNPIKNAMQVAVNTIPGNPALNLTPAITDKASLQGLGGCLAGGGCGCGGCTESRGMNGLGMGDFTSDYITPTMTYIEDAFTGPNKMWWIGGAAVAAFILFGRAGGAEYRYERKKLREKYQTYGQRAMARVTA